MAGIHAQRRKELHRQESLSDAEWRARLEEDLQRSGEYGQMLLRRVEQLEAENRRLQAQVEESLQSSEADTRARRRKAVSSSDLEDVREESGEEGYHGRRRANTDHRLSDALLQNEELMNQLSKLERDRVALRQNNEELKRLASNEEVKRFSTLDVAEPAPQKVEDAEEGKKWWSPEFKARIKGKIKDQRLRERWEEERRSLQAVVEQVLARESRVQEEAASLRVQVATSQAELQECRTLRSQMQGLLGERQVEVEDLRTRLQQLEATQQVESRPAGPSTGNGTSASLAAEMAEEEDTVLDLPVAALPSLVEQDRKRLSERVQQLERQLAAVKADKAQQPEAEPPVRNEPKPLQQPLLAGIPDPLRSSLQLCKVREEPAQQLRAGELGEGERATISESFPSTRQRWRSSFDMPDLEKDLQRVVASLQQRNLELTGECEQIRLQATTAMRWERRLLLLTGLLLFLLAAVVVAAAL